MQHRDNHAGPTHPERLPDGDRPAIDVDPVLVEAEPTAHGHALRGKRLVEFDQVEVTDADPRPLKHLRTPTGPMPTKRASTPTAALVIYLPSGSAPKAQALFSDAITMAAARLTVAIATRRLSLSPPSTQLVHARSYLLLAPA